MYWGSAYCQSTIPSNFLLSKHFPRIFGNVLSSLHQRGRKVLEICIVLSYSAVAMRHDRDLYHIHDLWKYKYHMLDLEHLLWISDLPER